MKKLMTLFLLLICLTGCKGEDRLLSQAIRFRGELVEAGGCSFIADLECDYGEIVEHFSLQFDWTEGSGGELTLLEPETIAGITARVSPEEGTVTYDGLALGFAPLAEDSVSPAGAPALVVDCWSRAYIHSAGEDGERYRVCYQKNYGQNAMLIDTYFENGIPILAELCYNGKRILKLSISDFTFH